jgi:uncharacterized membrane-anchored protein YhcB (DUF1043 family)
VGANGTWTKTIVALVAGAVLGYLSEMLAGMMSSTKATA